MTKERRVAIYERVPKEGDAASEKRMAELREYAERRGWPLVKEYVDSKGGDCYDRPGFREMVGDASRKKFDILLFWSLGTLSQEGVTPTLCYLKTLESYGVAYRSYTEEFLDSTGIFCDAIVSVIATMTQYQAGVDAERQSGSSA